ncbi:MAG: hypothetical protein WBD20_26250 [Pirellulaceae bacterium]
MNPIFKKELRDVIRWVPPAMVLGVVMVWIQLPDGIAEATHAESTLVMQLGLSAGIIALALGLLQSVFDIRNDARGYLLHRPVHHHQIFWAKVAAGFVAFLASLVIPVVVAITYLNWYGIEYMPSSGWQVVPACMYVVAVFLLHPTAIWIANRDARWAGTRVLPSIGVAAGLLLLAAIGLDRSDLSRAMHLTMVFGIALVGATAILLASRHAFAAQSHLPPVASRKHRNNSGVAILTISAVVLYGAVSAFLMESKPRQLQDSIRYELSVNQRGQMEELRETRSRNSWHNARYATRSIGSKEDFQSVSDDWQLASSVSLGSQIDLISQHRQFNYIGSYSSKSSAFGQVELVESNRRILVYAGGRLKGIITPDGAFKDTRKVTGHFADATVFNNLMTTSSVYLQPKSNAMILDANGIYQLDLDDFAIREIAKGKFDRMGLQFESDSMPAAVWTLAGTELTRYLMSATDQEDELPRADDETINRTYQYPLPQVEFTKSNVYEIEPAQEQEQIAVAQSDSASFLIRQYGNTVRYRHLEKSEQGELATIKLPSAAYSAPNENWLAWCFPPGLMGGAITLFMIFRESAHVPAPPALMITFLILHALVAAALTWLLSGTFGLSRRQRLQWTIAGAALGIGTLIALIAIYPKPIRESCPRCEKRRRVDLQDCQHCGNPWDPPVDEGIEIIQQPCSIEPQLV